MICVILNPLYLFNFQIGYLYLTNGKRLEKIMQKLGFSSDSSTEIIIEEAKPKPVESNLPNFILSKLNLSSIKFNHKTSFVEYAGSRHKS